MLYVHFYTLDESGEEWYGPFSEVWFEGLDVHVKSFGAEEYTDCFATFGLQSDEHYD